MAACEQGYLCAICGREVEEITDSDLYLRFVLGEVEAGLLNQLPERHIRCNPVLGQFIVSEGFVPIALEGPFAKTHLDRQFVSAEEERVTRGYLRLREISAAPRPIGNYPLADARTHRRNP
jgi:hypothetical protein